MTKEGGDQFQSNDQRDTKTKGTKRIDKRFSIKCS